MPPVSTNIKIDSELKQEAQELFSKMGLNLTSAINLFLFQSVQEQAIPFKIQLLPNKETTDAIREGEKIISEGTSRFSDAEAMFRDLGI